MGASMGYRGLIAVLLVLTVFSVVSSYSAAREFAYPEMAENFDDVSFSSAFGSGNLQNATFVSGDAEGNRLYQANIYWVNTTESCIGDPTDLYNWWFFFSMSNASGKNITVNITGLSPKDLEGRWVDARPRYSFDFGEGNLYNYSSDISMGTWHAILPTESYKMNAAGRSVSFTIAVPEGEETVWAASVNPYTVRHRDLYLESIASSPYVSTDVLNTTTYGLDLTAVTVTDPAYPDSKKVKVYVVGQQLANNEAQGSWVNEGAIDFLIGSDPEAAQIRRNYIYRFVPIVNVDGVYAGMGRWSPLYGGTTIYDTNRCWTAARNNQPAYNVVTWVYQDAMAFDPNASIDAHGTITTSGSLIAGYNYFLNDRLADSAMNAFTRNISVYWENVLSPTAFTGNANAFPNNMRLSPAAVHPSIMLESTSTNFSGTTDVPDQEDWKRYGKEMVQGIRDYYKNAANEPRNITVNYPIDWNLVSVPVILADNSTYSVWPGAASNVYVYANYGYVETTSVEAGKGYWLKFYGPYAKSYVGDSLSFANVSLNAEWNIVGSLSDPLSISSIQTAPAGIINSDFFGFNESGYYPVSTLLPGKAYWVSANQSGRLIMGTPASGAAKMASATIAGTLRVSDSKQRSASLYFGSPAKLLPPKMLGAFDARFATGTYVEALPSSGSKEHSITISSAQYPVRIDYQLPPGFTYTLSYVSSGKAVSKTILGKGSLSISDPAVQTVRLLVAKPAAPKAAPAK